MTDSVTNKIILSADSTCDLDQELKERYHVHYFPLHIILDGKDYKDGIDITPEEIYQKYYDEKILPKTAAVNVAEYIEHFKPWVDEGYEVIHINLGSSLSSAHQNCCIAAEELGHVHVIDSCSLSTGTGLLVTDAGRMIEQGLKAEDIAEALRERTKHCHASFILDTLTFLHAGGRCSTVAYGAPAILIVLADKNWANRVYDGSLVMGNMMLAAHSLNLGSIWIHRAKEEFELPEYQELLKEIGVEGEWEGIGHCAVGYVDGEFPKPAKRKDNRVFWVD